MTRLLVSVRDAREALSALAGGADLIDIKEPHAGSLGAASPEIVRQIVAAVNGRCPVSVALGELVDLDDRARDGDLAYCAGAAYAKVGLAGASRDLCWPECWKRQLERLPNGVRTVAVIYADHATCNAPSPNDVIGRAEQLGCAAVLIDTFDKAKGRLTEQWTMRELCELSQRVRRKDMLFVVAGSLAAEDFQSLEPLSADYFAVRRAVCESRRTGQLSQCLVEQLSEEIKRQSAAGTL